MEFIDCNISTTYAMIERKLIQQLNGLKIDDLRPNGQNKIYVWVKDSEINLIATYKQESDTFEISTTRQSWELLGL